MTRTDVKRLYLMRVGVMPAYGIPIVCALVQTVDGRNLLIDTGLPEVIPEDGADFENGEDVVRQLARLGLTPADIDTVISTHYDLDHAGRHAAFPAARYVVQRAHHADAVGGNPRFALLRSQWDQPAARITLVDGDTELLPGLTLVETGGHVVGHQSVLLRLPRTGSVLLTVDAVPFAAGFTRAAPDGDAPEAAQVHASTVKLLELAEREPATLVVFGHDEAQWNGLRRLPGYYD